MPEISKIVCLDAAAIYPATDERWKAFASVAPIEVFDRTAPSEIVNRAADAQIVLTNKVVLDAETIAALPKLRCIGILATGTNVVDIKAATATGIVVTNIPSYSTASVAQCVFALLLAITNRVEYYASQNIRGRWAEALDFSYTDMEWNELAGKTFGIVGFGHIGSLVARIAAAMGMKVAVYTSKDASELPEGYVKMELDELFAASDVLSLHCPLTPSTHHLVDSRRLALMKPTAIIINTSRGPVVDEQALADALNSGRIFAAGLDVLEQEPPKADCPLLGARNCFITPHIAWASTEARGRLMDIAVANVRAFASGTPRNVVN